MLLRCESLEPPMSQLGQTEKVSQRAFLDCCTPESGRSFERGERQLRANNSHSDQRTTHSITSSASNCRELGTSRPSALAVCMLMTNSHLVDCKTGMSAGFAPLRI